jgi:CDP-paratose 2-epimerase
MLEAIRMIEEISGKQLNFSISNEPRIGDHIWWISDISKFRKHYPTWSYSYDLRMIITEIIEATAKRLKGALRV